MGLVRNFNERMLKFQGVNVIAVEDKITGEHESDAWTGSRGTICSLLQEGLSGVTVWWNCEATSVDFNSGRISFIDNRAGAMMKTSKMEDNANMPEKITRERAFDLVVGADGAGSKVRSWMTMSSSTEETGEGGAPISFRRFNLDNYSIMLKLDRKNVVDKELGQSHISKSRPFILPLIPIPRLNAADPTVLYAMSINPLCVAGAINGPGGKSDPLWFCQVGFKSLAVAEKIKNMKLDEIKAFIGESVARYVSDDELRSFQKRQPQATGKGKVCSSWVRGRAVLLGDAAAPFPPVGQGVNVSGCTN